MSLTLGPIFNAQHGKTREWSIVVSLFDAASHKLDISDESSPPDVLEGYRAEYYTISGYTGMKMTQSAPTVVLVGKNLGKKNQTNVLTQAIKDCRSKYAAKLKAGYTDAQTTEPASSTSMPFPMAVKTWKDHGDKLKFPLYIQPKLDGIRLLARLEKKEVMLYTRRLHSVSGFTKLKDELLRMFAASGLKSFVVDGELYCHGMNLQVISGIVRNESASEETKEQLRYHVFDFFDPQQPMLDFDRRHALLQTFHGSLKADMIILNPTGIAQTPTSAEDMYNDYVRNGYEGVIYKSKDKPYEFDYNKEKRSSWYLKRKKQEDAEFAIIGYSNGKGKDKDCIVFRLQGPNNKTFNCVPNGTYEYRRALFAQAQESFKDTFEGKLAKVLYDDLSKDGVPLRGRIIQIGRDLSFD